MAVVNTPLVSMWQRWQVCRKSIVKRANDILKQLEADNRQQGIASKPMAEVGETRGGMQLSFFQLEDPVLCQIRDEILNLDVNNLTPWRH